MLSITNPTRRDGNIKFEFILEEKLKGTASYCYYNDFTYSGIKVYAKIAEVCEYDLNSKQTLFPVVSADSATTNQNSKLYVDKEAFVKIVQDVFSELGAAETPKRNELEEKSTAAAVAFGKEPSKENHAALLRAIVDVKMYDHVRAEIIKSIGEKISELKPTLNEAQSVVARDILPALKNGNLPGEAVAERAA